MPTYSYRCSKCSKEFDFKMTREEYLSSQQGTLTCPECGGIMNRVYKPVTIRFVGPGFYTTDNRRSSNENSD